MGEIASKQCCSGDEDLADGEGTRPMISVNSEEVVKDISVPANPAGGARPGEEFYVKIVKDQQNGTRLGIDVDLTDGVALVVDQVNPGLIQEWNEANPLYLISKFDRIIAINGSRGNANDLTEVCKTQDTLAMTIVKARA